MTGVPVTIMQTFGHVANPNAVIGEFGNLCPKTVILKPVVGRRISREGSLCSAADKASSPRILVWCICHCYRAGWAKAIKFIGSYGVS
jgi:hypothetical protein